MGREGLSPSLKSLSPYPLKGEGDKGSEVNTTSKIDSLEEVN